MKLTINRRTAVERSARVMQLEGLFDVPPTTSSERQWVIDLPVEKHPWQIGLVVGPSGSGKTTLAREAWPGVPFVSADKGYDWPAGRSLVDAFPAGMSINDITGLLSSVGFSTPPAWLRPFACLSTGEQFRATVARALADPAPLVVLDEFTSVVDRTVARIGSAAVGKAVRRMKGRQVVCVTCHDDVGAWLCPDWVVRMPHGEFARVSLRRPPVTLEVRRVGTDQWRIFKEHHYLNTTIHAGARCFAAYIDGRPVAFASSIHAPSVYSCWREHRTVCLPDFQGVGIGNALSEYVAGVMKALKGKYRSATGNPAMIRHRSRSPLWKVSRKPGMVSISCGDVGQFKNQQRTRAADRITAGFEFVGPALPDDARAFGLL